MASRCQLNARRIDSFEKGLLQLQMPENDNLVEIFKSAGIEFKGDLEVKLGNKKGDYRTQGGGSGQGMRIHVDATTLLPAEDETQSGFALKAVGRGDAKATTTPKAE